MRPAFLVLGVSLLVSPVVAQLTPADRLVDGQLVRRAQGRDFVALPGQLSLRLKDSRADMPEMLAQAALADARLADLQLLRVNRLGVADLSFPASRGHAQMIEGLLATGLVDFVEPAFVGAYVGDPTLPNDAFFDQQWNLFNEGQTGGQPGADVRALDAWVLEDGDASVVVAVLDSGSDWNAPDLSASIWSNTAEVVNGLDDDNNGFIDDVRGWNFNDGDNDPSGVFSHGTNVASIIGARADNALEIAGVAGGATDGEGCSVMPLNVGSFAPLGDVLDDAILYAADNGARVITMSLIVPSSKAIEAAVQAAHEAGAFLDCASGNAGSSVSFPANLPLVMAVGSTDFDDNVSSFSNFGPEVEIVAPGEFVPVLNIGGQTSFNTGTSFSAPHIAAAAGLAFSLNPELSNEQVRELLQTSAREIDASPEMAGSGVLDLHALLLAVQGLEPPVDAAVTEFGEGLAGLAGVTPRAGSTGGRPLLGNLSFRLTLSEARPAAMSYLLLGFAAQSKPFAGGELLVDFSAPGRVIPHLSDGLGEVVQSARIGEDPNLAGLEVFSQWVVVDDAAAQGFALSAGLGFTIGS